MCLNTTETGDKMQNRTRKNNTIIGAIMALFLCIGGIHMADKEFTKGDVFIFDMGTPGDNQPIKKQRCNFDFTDEQIQEILATIPEETLAEYGINEAGDDTPNEAEVEGQIYAQRLNAEETGLLTRMTREGYTISDKSDFYDFTHGKWSSRAGYTPGYIIPHHMAGNLTPQQFYAIMHSTRQMSCHVSIHTDGTVYAWVPENCRSWCTGGWEQDKDSLTMEIANDEIGGDWHISDKAYDTAVAICAEWCKRYGIDPYWKPGAMGTIQMHKEWAQTACPGPYLSRKIESGQFEADVRAAMNPKPPTPSPKPGAVKYRVQCGAFAKESNARTYQKMIETKTKIQTFIRFEARLYKVQCGAFSKRENAEAMAAKLKANGFKAIIKEI